MLFINYISIKQKNKGYTENKKVKYVLQIYFCYLESCCLLTHSYMLLSLYKICNISNERKKLSLFRLDEHYLAQEMSFLSTSSSF